MVLKVYGHPLSTSSQLVSAVLYQLDVPYELITVDVFGGANKSQDYLAKQPFGQVPYLDDDGFILFESRAICRYIVEKYGNGKLMPQDVRGRALFEQAASIEYSNFDPFASPLVHEAIVKRQYHGKEPDQALVEQLKVSLDGKLNGYEAILGKQKYLAGDELTVVDLFHLPYGSRLSAAGAPFLEDTAKRPNVARWWKEVSSLQSWQRVQNSSS